MGLRSTRIKACAPSFPSSGRRASAAMARLAAALSEADAARRTELVEAAQEELGGDEPSDHTIHHLLQLLADADADVRRAALAFAAEAGPLAPKALSRLLPPIVAMLHDESAVVVKRCLMTSAALLRPALRLLAADKLPLSDEHSALAESVNQLRLDAIGMLSNAAHKDTVRTQAVKLCEAVVLACTPEPSSGESDASESGVVAEGVPASAPSEKPVIMSHAIFGGATAAQWAHETLRCLTGLLADPPSPTLLCVTANSLALSIARSRPAMLPSIVEALTSCQSHLVPAPGESAARIVIPAAGLANVQQALKSAMISLVKQLHTLSPDALVSEGSSDGAAATSKKEAERSLFSSLVAAGASNQLQMVLRQMGREMPSAEELRPAIVPGAGSADGVAGPSGVKRLHNDDNAGPDAKRHEGGAVLQQSSTVDNILRKLAPELVAELVIATMAQLPPPPSTGAIPVADGVPHLPPEVKPNELPPLLDGLMDELLSPVSERLLRTSGRRAELHSILGRFASTQPLLGAYHSRLLEHVLELPHERLELVLAWAYAEYLEHSVERYDELFDVVLATYNERLPPNDRLWTKLLLLLPRLPAGLLDVLRADVAYGANPRLMLGLTTLRDLLLQRDAWRDACASLLLELCSSDDEALRAPAVRLVASIAAGEGVAQAANVEAVAWRIRRHAAEQMQAGLVSSDEETTGKLLLIYLALCARSPQMLEPLLTGLADATPEAAAAVQRQLPGLLLQLPIEPVSEVLLKQLRNEAAGGPVTDATEPGASPLLLLVLQMVADRAAAEGGSVPTTLVEGVIELVTAGSHSSTYLVPLLPFVLEHQLGAVLPALLRLPTADMREALAQLLHAEPPLTRPAQLMVELHVLDVDTQQVPLKAVMDAVQACLNERTIFTQEELTGALEEIVRLEPLPLLTMRTIIQALVHWPKAVNAVMLLLDHLLARQVWTMPKLWAGFVKCCQMAMPASARIYLAMPKDRLEAVLESDAATKAKLLQHANSHRDTIPAPTLAALGLT